MTIKLNKLTELILIRFVSNVWIAFNQLTSSEIFYFCFQKVL